MKKFYKKFCAVEMGLAGVCLLVSVTTILISAIVRCVGHPINWGTDVALLLFTWSTFLGADLAWRQGKLVNVDLLFKALSPKAQKYMKLLIYTICLIFLCAMVYLGFVQSVKTWYRSFNGVPWLSFTWATLSVPVACTSMVVTTILKIIMTIKDQSELTFF